MRVALVTGVSSGIGNATARALVERGYRVFGTVRSETSAVPAKVERVLLDVRDAAAIAAGVREVLARAGRIDLRSTAVMRQEGEYCEHMRWAMGGFLFVTLNVQGSNNIVRHGAEHAKRMAAVYAWLDDSATLAQKGRVGLVVVMQGNPFITLPRDGYQGLRERLIRLGERTAGRLLLVHGDTHTYHDDEPLPGVRRLEV